MFSGAHTNQLYVTLKWCARAIMCTPEDAEGYSPSPSSP